uniref:Acidic mammalian chitinase-like isoform X1 n=1 Tax=Dermatophagoides pteronyssinus TaxID=6956 RepID=A0A6P6XYI7_DERPT|nr:acidic mammalian chitinase-like isoform X1 [Dermatophagoides pteronyssinus]
MKILIFFLLLSSLSLSQNIFKRICYLRPESNFPIDYVIQNNICTHIIIAFVSIDSESNLSFDQTFIDFLQLCRQSIDTINNNENYPKLMFSIGGGGAGGWKMASSTDERRKRFVQSILQFIQQYQLDGVDIDWEFPSWPKKLTQYSERNDFIKLLQEIRRNFDHEKQISGKHLILSAAVAAQFVIIQVSYKPVEMAESVDFINLMTYDYFIHKWYWPYVGHNSPLYSPINLPFNFINVTKTFSVEWSAEYWVKIGMPRHKIMVGIPTYGKRYTLFHSKINYPGAMAISGGNDMIYSEVCEFLKRKNTVEKYDSIAHSPYAYNEREWISFENQQSASQKAKWIRMKNFGGLMIFSLNADDYRQQCSNNIDNDDNDDSKILFPIHMAIRDSVINS